MPLGAPRHFSSTTWPIRALSSGARWPWHPGRYTALQAYGGLQAWAARAHRPAQSLGRVGSLEVPAAFFTARFGKRKNTLARFMRKGPPSQIPQGYRPRAGYGWAMTRSATTCRSRPHRTQSRRAQSPISLERVGSCGSHSPKIMAVFTARASSISEICLRAIPSSSFWTQPHCVLAPYRNKRTVKTIWHHIHTVYSAEPLRCHVRMREPKTVPTPGPLALVFCISAPLCVGAPSWRARALSK